MNPTITQAFVDAQYERDPSSAMAELGAQFRNDIDSYVTREAIRGVMVPGRRELLPVASGVNYVGFCDPSGGSADSMTLGVAHKEKEVVVLDCVREVRPPFSPESVTRDFAITLKSYRIRKVIGDRYAGEWVIEQFKINGITYELAEQAKSDIYRDVLPMIHSGKVELLDLAERGHDGAATSRSRSRRGSRRDRSRGCGGGPRCSPAGGDEPPPPLETGDLSYANWRSSADKLIDPTTLFCPVRKGHFRLLSLQELATCFQNSARGWNGP